MGVELKGDAIRLQNGATLYFLGTNSRTAQGRHGDLYVDEYFWIPDFKELTRLAKPMAAQKQYRITYFSTPSSTSHPAYSFWNGQQFNEGRPKSEHISLDVSHAALSGGRLCEDGQFRHIVTLDDAERGSCNLFDRKQLLTEFFRRLILAEIEPQNRIALILNMLTFLRSTELRGGQWNEIDFDAAMWTVPAQRMKHEKTAPKPPHAVPLADWTLELLAELKEITGNTPFLFPSRTKTDGFISDATISRIIERMGYKGRVTPHGFRFLASSVLNEQGFNPDAIERQLAHIENNKIRAAYNRADYLTERKEFMQWYGNFLWERYRQALKQIQSP